MVVVVNEQQVGSTPLGHRHLLKRTYNQISHCIWYHWYIGCAALLGSRTAAADD
jgi:hypothetical protein